MNTYTAEYRNRFDQLTDEEWGIKEIHQEMKDELIEIMSITSAAEAALEMPEDETCTIEDAAGAFGEAPETIRDLVEEHQALLALDGWKEPYLSFRAFLRLATLLPHNWIAQEYVWQILDRALK